MTRTEPTCTVVFGLPAVGDGVGLGVGVADGFGVGVAVGVGVGVGVGEGFGVAVGEGFGVGVGEGVGVAVGESVASRRTKSVGRFLKFPGWATNPNVAFAPGASILFHDAPLITFLFPVRLATEAFQMLVT